MYESIGTWWMWTGFFIVVLAMIAADLLLLGGGRRHKVSVREAAGWTVVWVLIALAFNGLLWWYLDGSAGRAVANEKSLEFLTGYVMEKSLAVDNIFVWLVIFGYFAVPPEFQRRVLLFGVLGAIVLRTVMIIAGAWLIREFHWILYFFGLLLVVTGIKMLVFADKQPDLASNPVLVWMRRHLRITDGFHGERFIVMRDGVRFFTPLFLVLALVELSDVVFAVDSIPAIFAITSDPFIVLTSNVFAILGLRAMYFLLKDVADRFHYLKYGLALVLMFVGSKMLIVDVVKIPVLVSLAVVASIIGLSVAASLLLAKPHAPPRALLPARRK
ncbi:MAG TPA: TerC family protein [Noviherbaspirillum sp.]|uniref:TerC family protein n=1 Tax=Noviherbaspirillum sp. TaxID=1926288 RepID=UPI002D630914|nr:TerC family protein [Noviherbaspirillum sp.]HYD94901.1 TerC family protein [Noviherbaspirillum sp.]